MTRNERILALRGKKSFGLIAEELGISRSTVAGVMWRADWPYSARKDGTCGLGRGWRAIGAQYAKRHKRLGRPKGTSGLDLSQ